MTPQQEEWGSDFFGGLNEMPPEPVTGISHVLDAMTTLTASGTHGSGCSGTPVFLRVVRSDAAEGSLLTENAAAGVGELVNSQERLCPLRTASSSCRRSIASRFSFSV
jgi:hypothetical protein